MSKWNFQLDRSVWKIRCHMEKISNKVQQMPVMCKLTRKRRGKNDLQGFVEKGRKAI